MRIVLDTNVLVSGIFFTGPPFEILQAWRDRKIQLVLSIEILDEYRRVATELGSQFPDVDISSFLDLVTVNSNIVEAPALPEPVCADTDDDKFIACAIASKTKLIVSGDKHLLKADGFRNIRVFKPRDFADKYL
jgi:putative toxin-antitoxin system toxin component, PIN family